MQLEIFHKGTSRALTIVCLQSVLWLPALIVLLGEINFTDNFVFFSALPILAAAHSVAPLLLARHETVDAQRSLWKAAIVLGLFSLLLVVWARWGGANEPLSLSYGLFIFAVAYFIFNTWHFALQNYGILGLMGRARGEPSKSTRRMDKFFCFAHGLICIPLLWIPEKRHLSLLFERLPSAFLEMPWASISMALVVGAFVVSTIFMLKRRFFSWDRQLYGLGMALQVVVMAQSNFLTSVIIYFVPHWLAEVALVSRAFPEARQRAKSWGVYLLYVIYVLLFINYAVAREYPVIREWFSTGAVNNDMVGEQSLVVALSMVGFFLIVFLHYSADRVVYRRGSPSLASIMKKLN